MLTGEHVRHKMVPGGSAFMEFPGRIKRRADPPGEAGLHRRECGVDLLQHHAVGDDEQVDVAARRIGSVRTSVLRTIPLISSNTGQAGLA